MPAPFVIDAHGHVLDSTPSIDWAGLLDEPYKSRAPKHLPFNTGGGRLFIEGEIIAQPTPGRVMRGRKLEETHAQRDGMWRPEQRMPDMDLDGIDVAVLFGGAVHLSVPTLKDAGFAAALARAYNTWLADYCGYAPERLKGIAAAPFQDAELGIEELERAVKKLGFVGAGVPPNVRGVNPDSALYEPLYAAAERLDTPVCIHMGTRFPGIASAGADRCNNYFLVHLMTHAFEQMLAMACVISGGVFDRYPRLRVAFLEAGLGWAPYWAERMDGHYETLGAGIAAKAKPSEYVRGKQCYISCEVDEELLATSIDFVGEDRVLYASDYWHFDGTFPGTVKAMKERKDLSEGVKRKVLGLNAARLYGIPVKGATS